MYCKVTDRFPFESQGAENNVNGTMKQRCKISNEDIESDNDGDEGTKVQAAMP
jgi:hypothetical protein